MFFFYLNSQKTGTADYGTKNIYNKSVLDDLRKGRRGKFKKRKREKKNLSNSGKIKMLSKTKKKDNECLG